MFHLGVSNTLNPVITLSSVYHPFPFLPSFPSPSMYGRDLDYRDVPDVNVDELPAEQTKYLGGDLQHTHLVKGLDYQLLAKLKEQAERMEEERFEQYVVECAPFPSLCVSIYYDDASFFLLLYCCV